MPLVTTKELLLKAQEGHYAVGAFNVENMEMVMLFGLLVLLVLIVVLVAVWMAEGVMAVMIADHRVACGFTTIGSQNRCCLIKHRLMKRQIRQCQQSRERQSRER